MKTSRWLAARKLIWKEKKKQIPFADVNSSHYLPTIENGTFFSRKVHYIGSKSLFDRFASFRNVHLALDSFSLGFIVDSLAMEKNEVHATFFFFTKPGIIVSEAISCNKQQLISYKNHSMQYQKQNAGIHCVWFMSNQFSKYFYFATFPQRHAYTISNRSKNNYQMHSNSRLLINVTMKKHFFLRSFRFLVALRCCWPWIFHCFNSAIYAHFARPQQSLANRRFLENAKF